MQLTFLYFLRMLWWVETYVRAIPYKKVCGDKDAVKINPAFLENVRDLQLLQNSEELEFTLAFISSFDMAVEPEEARCACSEIILISTWNPHTVQYFSYVVQ